MHMRPGMRADSVQVISNAHVCRHVYRHVYRHLHIYVHLACVPTENETAHECALVYGPTPNNRKQRTCCGGELIIMQTPQASPKQSGGGSCNTSNIAAGGVQVPGAMWTSAVDRASRRPMWTARSGYPMWTV